VLLYDLTFFQIIVNSGTHATTNSPSDLVGYFSVLAEDSASQTLLEAGSAFLFRVDLSGSPSLTSLSSAGQIVSESASKDLPRQNMAARSTTTKTVVMHCPKASSECTDDSHWSEVPCSTGCKITGTSNLELSTKKFGTYMLKQVTTTSSGGSVPGSTSSTSGGGTGTVTGSNVMSNGTADSSKSSASKISATLFVAAAVLLHIFI
jgi:hypothetical protein